MRDGLYFGSLPLFTGALAFLPGCPADSGMNTETSGSTGDGSGSSTGGSATLTTSTSMSESSSSESSISTTADTSTSSPETTGDPECGGGTCGSPAPSGWFGPTIYAAVGAGAELPACPAEYPDTGPTVLAGFNAPAATTCDCTCTLSGGGGCNGGLQTHAQADCYDWIGYSNITEGCTNVAINGFVTAYAYGGYPPPTCMKDTTEEIPPVAWDATIRTCRLSETSLSCNDGGVCLPPPPEDFEATWCIYQQGDVECPAGPFGNKQMFYTGVEDTRDCTNCTCGTAGTDCQNGEVQIFAAPDCAGEPVATVPFGNVCTAAVGNSVAGDFGGQAPCPINTAPMPEGDVAATGPFTFCCTG